MTSGRSSEEGQNCRLFDNLESSPDFGLFRLKLQNFQILAHFFILPVSPKSKKFDRTCSNLIDFRPLSDYSKNDGTLSCGLMGVVYHEVMSVKLEL